VREALAEREVLLSIAPHIARPLRFILPHHAGLRPAWLLRAGLFLYDHLGPRRTLPGTATLDLRCEPESSVLNPRFRRAFEYSDFWVDDARLVVLNARDAADKGAEIRTRTKIMDATRAKATWRLTLVCQTTGRSETIRARLLINAAGPWLETALPRTQGHNTKRTIRLVKGSHIVVPRIGSHDQAFIFQNKDGRIVFLIPYERNFSLIGTTDVVYDGDPGRVAISPAETDYLCAAVNRFLARPVTPADVVWSYAGVRPLYDDGASNASETTRDYVLSLDGGGAAGAPALSIFGGKITTFRRLAEHALEKLSPFFPAMKPAWTSTAKLPGGELDGIDGDVAGFVARLGTRFGFVPEAHLRAMARRQGGRVLKILGGAARIEDLGPHFGAGLYAREVDLMVGEEWARTPNDILFRRSKLGLHIGLADQAALGSYLAEKHGLGRVPA